MFSFVMHLLATMLMPGFSSVTIYKVAKSMMLSVLKSDQILKVVYCIQAFI